MFVMGVLLHNMSDLNFKQNVKVDSARDALDIPRHVLPSDPVSPVRLDESALDIGSVSESSTGRATQENASPGLSANQIHQSRWILGLPIHCPEFRAAQEKSDIGRRHLAAALRWQALGCPDPVISLTGRYDEEWMPEVEEWLDSLEAKVSLPNTQEQP